jgi:hypothetical protein
MNIFDKFLHSVSYKFPKGYPDMSDPTDVLLLESLINEKLGENVNITNVLTEDNSSYDALIQSALKTKDIPKCKTPLSVGESFNLRGDDEKIWTALYPVKPLKADGTPTAGSGNGEVATYWAYQHNIKSIDVIDGRGGRGGENPDLIIGGVGVEVKAYDTKTITLGKFGTDTETVSLLNKVFGTLSLFNEETIKANTGNFKPQDLLNGFKIISEIYSNNDLKKLDIAKPFFSKIDTLYKTLGLDSNPTPEEATVALLRKLLWTKLIKKPNMNQEVGYILNVNLFGKGDYTKITSDIIFQIPDENLLNNGIAVKSSEISMNFNQLFK